MNYQYKISKPLPTKDLGAWEREAIKELERFVQINGGKKRSA